MFKFFMILTNFKVNVASLWTHLNTWFWAGGVLFVGIVETREVGPDWRKQATRE